MNYSLRQTKLQQTLAKQGLDGLVVTHPANLRYLCGYTGSNGLLLLLAKRCAFFTDGRYTGQARAEVKGSRIVIARGPLIEDAANIVGDFKPATLGFEGEHTSVLAAGRLRELIPKKIKLKPTSALVERQRMIKDADELRLIQRAVELGVAVYGQALKAIRPGVRESEVAGKLEFAARKRGADGMSFDTIVAAGKRSALPHGRASSQVIPRRGFVVVDSGVILDGYCSDMTRTPHVGRVTRQERGWYEAVLEAQLAGIGAVRPGATAGDVDAAARNVLRKAKLDHCFTHSTGHGVGLEIHEPPRLGKQQAEILEDGMVITIEPGIYIPGKGGIRIEDMVLVTARGSQVLTPLSKQLIEIES
jgi:Xaa-Pro aminopeptidase